MNHNSTSSARRQGMAVVAALGAFLSVPALAETWRVPDDFDCIQEAIDAASSGDEIIVGDGIWTGSCDKNLDFTGKTLNLHSENGPENCIIDCQNSGRAFNFHSNESNAAVVEGFTIRNGRTVAGRGGAISCDGSHPTICDCVFEQNSVTSGGTSTGGGGAVVLNGSQAVLEDCTFTDNTAFSGGNITGFGGALAIRQSSVVTVSNCDFEGNTATAGTSGFRGFGGAVSVSFDSIATFVGCDFQNNSAHITAGGIFVGSGAVVTLEECTLKENTCDGSGGGITVDGTTDSTMAEMIRCRVIDNHAAGVIESETGIGGGGFAGVGGGATLQAVNCIFHGNSTTVGAGISIVGGGAADIWNSLLVHNQGYNAAAVNCSFGSDVTLVNSTVSDNTTVTDSGSVSSYSSGSDLTVTSSVVYGNTSAGDVQISQLAGGLATVTYTDVGGGWPGAGNISGDPLFVDPDGPDDDPETWEDNDYRPATGSPVIDAGSNLACPPDTFDLDGNGNTTEPMPIDLGELARFFDDPSTPDTGNGASPPIMDMGSYEYQLVECKGDVNGDLVVDVTDLVEVITNWGPCPGCAADINSDGVVDVTDLVELITAWGACDHL